MVCNTDYHNIAIISWQSFLLVEETGENRRPVECYCARCVTLSKHLIHYAPRSDFLYYNLSKPFERAFSIRSCGRSEEMCGFEPCEPSSVSSKPQGNRM